MVLVPFVLVDLLSRVRDGGRLAFLAGFHARTLPLRDIFSLQFQGLQNLERYLFGECSVRELTESISFMTSERSKNRRGYATPRFLDQENLIAPAL